MGIIRAAAGAIGGSLADSWLEYITAGDMGPTTVLTKGVQVTRGKRGSNRTASKLPESELSAR